jgi:sulfite reductase alpha subunit-like flavoprotein
MVEQIKKQVDLLVIYASQTGNCEAISEDLTNNLNEAHGSQFKALGVVDGEAKRFVMEDH